MLKVLISQNFWWCQKFSYPRWIPFLVFEVFPRHFGRVGSENFWNVLDTSEAVPYQKERTSLNWLWIQCSVCSQLRCVNLCSLPTITLFSNYFPPELDTMNVSLQKGLNWWDAVQLGPSMCQHRHSGNANYGVLSMMWVLESGRSCCEVMWFDGMVRWCDAVWVVRVVRCSTGVVMLWMWWESVWFVGRCAVGEWRRGWRCIDVCGVVYIWRASKTWC